MTASAADRQTPSLDFVAAYDRVKRHIEERYELAVSISDVIDPNTGDFNGMEIKLDYDQEIDTAFFVLIHLFGHTVQWNVSEEYRALGEKIEPGRTEEELARIYHYERDATRLSITLLHEAGVHGFEQWASDMWAADWRYLEHFYRTGEKLDFRSLIKPGAEQLTPLPIPPFVPQKWISRWAF